MSIQGISGTMNHIKQVQRLTYVMDKSPATNVILYVNKSQYAGRYASINDAQLAAQGLLTKCGCSRPDERILNVPQEIITPGLRTITTPNWIDISIEYDQVIQSFGYNSASQRMTLQGNAIVLQLSGTSKDVSLYVKRSFSPIALTTVSPVLEGYTKVNLFPAYLIVSPNEYVRFKCDHNYKVPYPTATSALELVTVTNLSNNGSAVDTFNMNYTVII